MEGPVRIAVTSRSLFDGGAETLHFAGTGTLRPTAAGWDLPYTAACRENGAALSSRIRLTADGKLKGCLHSREEISLRGLHGRELEDAILRGILQKPKGHHLTEHASDTPRTMNEIGG